LCLARAPRRGLSTRRCGSGCQVLADHEPATRP
jgi:hypothetical protein